MVETSREPEPRAVDGTSEATSALERAERAFAAGDHGVVQRALTGLPGGIDAAARARADKLARAVNADPAFVGVVAVCAIALFGVFAHYVLGGAP